MIRVREFFESSRRNPGVDLRPIGTAVKSRCRRATTGDSTQRSVGLDTMWAEEYHLEKRKRTVPKGDPFSISSG